MVESLELETNDRLLVNEINERLLADGEDNAENKSLNDRTRAGQAPLRGSLVEESSPAASAGAS